MAIISCTECGHNVSDKAEFCPNCGYSVNNILNDMKDKIFCLINGKLTDTTEIKSQLSKLTQEELDIYKYIYSVKGMSDTIIKWMKRNNEKELQLYNNSSELQRKYYPILDLTPQAMDEFLCMFIDNNLEPFEFDGDSFQDWQNRQREKDLYRPKCPHCHSINIAKISGTERAASVLGLGLLSKKINKSFKCKNCGYTW